jgi:uncharacterized protein
MVGHASQMHPGDPALLRHVFRGRVGWALPCTVVEDTAERVALLRRKGTPSKSPRVEDAESLIRSLADGTFEPEDSSWRHTNVVEIAYHGRASSVWPMWFDTWEFIGWYVNLQEPMRRTRFGFDTFDQSLDVVVHADLTWRWKDEDHFELLQSHGILSPAEADAVRREGERVIADAEARRPPFDEPWPDWRPDPSWRLPTLPEDWQQL